MSSYPPPPPPPPPQPSRPGWDAPPSAPPPLPPAGYGTPTYGHGVPYGYATPSYAFAGFWQRFAASFIDGLFGFLFAIPTVVLFIASAAAGRDTVCTNIDGELTACREPNWPLFVAGLIVAALSVVAWYVYMCRRLGRTGQTPGRKAMGIRVIDKDNGQPIGSGRAFGRYLFAGFLSGSICYLGYLWMLWEPQKRTWHDMALNSIVVRA